MTIKQLREQAVTAISKVLTSGEMGDERVTTLAIHVLSVHVPHWELESDAQGFPGGLGGAIGLGGNTANANFARQCAREPMKATE